ncbi:dynamin family protein [Chloroflexota bacterium]
MSGVVLEGPLAELREREIRLLYEAGDVVTRLSEKGTADRDRLRDVANDLRDLFLMVVVVGEFNAGKSTFINALLGDELLPTGITPTTEVIELIRYDETVTHGSALREDGVREWSHPQVGGAGVVLVDTPGTGSVFEKHEQTARNFLHRSDLVIFVLSAKRAFAETDRRYMQVIRDYGKKVVAVVNQCDLLEKREQSDVRRFVQTQIEQRLELKPLIFMVSARQALQDDPDSGMAAVRAHLHATFEQVSPAQQKLLTQLDFTEHLLTRHQGVLENRLELIGRNRAQTSQIQQELTIYADGMNAQLSASSAEMTRILAGMRQRGMIFVDQHFKLRLRAPGLDSDKLRQEFEDVVVGRSLEQLNDIANDYVNAQVDSNRRYWQGIVVRLNEIEDLLREDVKGVDGSVYSEQRLALQEAIAIADAEVGAYSNQEMLSVMRQRFQTNLTGFSSSAGVGVLGALAALLGAATPGAITLHVFALLGVAVGVPIAIGGGAAAAYYWRKLRRDVRDDFNGQIDLLAGGYRQAMVELTDRERHRLLQYGNQILEPVFSHFTVLADTAEHDLAALEQLQGQLSQLRTQIDAVADDHGA